MLHKKRKPSTFTSSSGVDCKYDAAQKTKLHSKSTYFYRWLSNLGVAGRSCNSTNGIRCPSPHCEQSGTSSDALCANRTRDSRETIPYSRIASYAGSPDGKESRLIRSRRQTNSYSKITDRPGYMVPVGCSLALLLGIGIIFNPAINNAEEVHAETVTANPTDYSSISLTISNNGTELNTGDTISTNVEPGLINYISNSLKIDTKKINRFYVSVQAAEDGSSELTGTVNKATIAPVGNNKIPTATDGNGFGDNTWGFALGDSTATNESLLYNSLPAYGTSTAPQYSSATNLADGTYNLKLTFAAKINADKPSDHYTTKAMVSVAADAKLVGFLNESGQKITTMQEMTSDICENASDGYSTQLVDDRSQSGLGETLYWVTKFKDGNCWMTQNLDLALAQGNVLRSADTDVAANYTISNLDSYKDPGDYAYRFGQVGTSSGCGDPSSSACEDYFKRVVNNSGNEEAHYLIGNYYPLTVAMVDITNENAGSICPKGWKVPPVSSYDTLFEGYNGSIIADPYYFVPGGVFNISDGDHFAAYEGYYWSSTVHNDVYFRYLGFWSGGGRPNLINSFFSGIGLSLRCVAR